MGDLVQLESKDIDFKKLVPQLLDQYNAKSTTMNSDQSARNFGLMGAARAGKDSAADYLISKYGYTKFAFGTKLKQIAHDLFGASKTKERGLYQWFGQECRKIDEDIWIKLLVSDVNRSLEEDDELLFIVTDIRQPNERLWSEDHGLEVIKIEATIEKRIDRMIARGDNYTPEQLRDKTERMIEILTHDYLIDNNGTKQTLHEQIDSIMNN